MIFLEADTNEYHLNKLKTCSYVGYNKLKIRSSCADRRLDFSNQLKFPWPLLVAIFSNIT